MFEYIVKNITISGYGEIDAIQRFLDSIGNDGWELIKIDGKRENGRDYYGKDEFVFFVIMKRKIDATK